MDENEYQPVLKVEYKKENSRHSYRRILARTLDFALVNSLIALFYSVVLKFSYSGNDLLTTYVAQAIPFMLITIIFEPIFISKFGTTLGKKLFKIYIFDNNGGLLSYGDALKRTGTVLIKGYGLGVPILNIISIFRVVISISTENKTDYDHAYSVEIDEIIGVKSALAAFGIVVLDVALVAFASLTLILVPNRGDINQKEFVENFNFALEEGGYYRDEIMLDGGGSINYAPYGTPLRLEFEKEGDIIKKVSFEVYIEEHTEIIAYEPMMKYATIAINSNAGIFETMDWYDTSLFYILENEAFGAEIGNLYVEYEFRGKPLYEYYDSKIPSDLYIRFSAELLQ